jgi:fucose 4-O-acetylase-like acetyltransferase
MLIDIVRGLAISLVALGHTNQGIVHRGWWGASQFGNTLDRAIYYFHMPAFFFVSGIFLYPGVNKRGPRGYAAERLRTVLYPYALWSVIQYAGIKVFHRYTVQSVPTPHQYLVNLVTGNFSWFLPTIFVALMIAVLLRRSPPTLLFVLAVVVALLWRPVGAADIDLALHFLPFLVAGTWVGMAFERLERVPAWAAPPIAAAICVLLAEVAIHNLGASIYLFLPLGFLGIFMLLMVARTLGKGRLARLFAWAGQASFGIFLLSQYPQGAIRELLWHGLDTTQPVLHLIVATLLAVLLPAWFYQYRVRLRIAWLFVWPFSPGHA